MVSLVPDASVSGLHTRSQIILIIFQLTHITRNYLWFFLKHILEDQSDQDLVLLYKKDGDIKVSRIIVPALYGPVVCRMPKYRKVGNSKGCVMGIFEELIPKVLKHDIHNFKGWLYGGKNYCLMQLRKKQMPHMLDPILCNYPTTCI